MTDMDTEIMTDIDRLRAIGTRLYGDRWQTAMAHDLGVQARQVRRWVRGDNAIPDGVWADLAAVEGERKGWPRDEWLIARGNQDRRYIVHGREPRFIARVARAGEDADAVTGIVHVSQAAGVILCEIVWIDPAPISEPEVVDLMARAIAALAASSP